jgi:hypothetical protein
MPEQAIPAPGPVPSQAPALSFPASGAPWPRPSGGLTPNPLIGHPGVHLNNMNQLGVPPRPGPLGNPPGASITPLHLGSHAALLELQRAIHLAALNPPMRGATMPQAPSAANSTAFPMTMPNSHLMPSGVGGPFQAPPFTQGFHPVTPATTSASVPTEAGFVGLGSVAGISPTGWHGGQVHGQARSPYAITSTGILATLWCPLGVAVSLLLPVFALTCREGDL